MNTDTKVFSEKGAYAGKSFDHEVLEASDVLELANNNPELVCSLLNAQLVQHQFSSAARTMIDGEGQKDFKGLREGSVVFIDSDGVYCLNRDFKPGTRVAGGAEKAKAFEARVEGAKAGLAAAGIPLTDDLIAKITADARTAVYG